MPDPESLNTETRTLRRIALLVLRAREDEHDRSVVDGLTKVAAVIDRMKRDLAIGSHASPSDVNSLAMLVRRLPKTASGPLMSGDLARQSLLVELRELVSLLYHTRREVFAGDGGWAEAVGH